MIILDQCHSASEKLWAYPFPNPTLTVACHQLTVVVQGRGRWTVPQIQTLNDNFSQIQNLTIAPLSWHYKEDTLGEKNYCIMQPDLTKKKKTDFAWFHIKINFCHNDKILTKIIHVTQGETFLQLALAMYCSHFLKRIPICCQDMYLPLVAMPYFTQ